MKRRIFVFTFIAILNVFLIHLSCFSQVTQEWVARYNNGFRDYAYSIAVDDLGNVYVTGYCGNVFNYDFATVKYNSSGIQQWSEIYDGTGSGTGYDDDIAKDIVVDALGNVYVTGRCSSNGTGSEYLTIKYSSSGDSIWVRKYDGPGGNEPMSMAIDESGNVYVTGYSGLVLQQDYATIKYNPTGDSVWVRRYNGPGNSYDRARDISVDNSGNVYVTGVSEASSTLQDYATIKYNSAGETVWVTRYNGSGNSYDDAYSVAVDGLGNVYVTGYSIGSGTSQDYATIKYNSSGIQQWVSRYNGSGNSEDYAYSIALDGLGNVYVTGVSRGIGTGDDYATIKYNSLGVQQWVQRYNGTENSEDIAQQIAVDISGNAYVTGVSRGIETLSDYATIKYNSLGDSVWVKRYHGPGDSDDGTYSVVVKNTGAVYVTGYSVGGSSGYDYATIKYSQSIGIEQIYNSIPTTCSLDQNYPNPFNPNSKIGFHLKERVFAKVVIYNSLGKLITTLVNEELDAGSYQTDWNASDYPSGVYFYELIAGKFQDIKRMVLVK